MTEKWREVVSCARGGMNTHVEDEIEGCNYIFGNMSGDEGGKWQSTKTKEAASMRKEQEAGKELQLELERDSLHWIK